MVDVAMVDVAMVDAAMVDVAMVDVAMVDVAMIGDAPRRSVRAEDAAYALRRGSQERIPCDVPPEAGEVKVLPLQGDRADRHLPPDEQRWQRAPERARDERGDGTELLADRGFTGRRDDEPIGVRQHQGFEPTSVTRVLELVTQGEGAVGAATLTTFFEHPLH
jgi:hypothetical protein